jgi:hypothetical protein
MKKVWVFWAISLLLALVCVFVNQYYFRMTEMIKLEFASSPEQMRTHIMAVGCSPECCYHTLKMNTLVDFGFLIAYSMLTFFSLKLFLDVFQVSVKIWVYILSFITGFLDVIENYFLLKTAFEKEETYSCIFFLVVRIKWAFAIVPLLLIPMVILYSLIVLLRTKKLVDG